MNRPSKQKDGRLCIVSKPIQLTTDQKGLLGLGPDGTRYRKFCNYGSERRFSGIQDLELIQFIDVPGVGLFLDESDFRFVSRLLAKLKPKQSLPA